MQFEGATRHEFISTIWRSESPLKCRIFAWLASLGKCNTADCLEKKRWPHNAACVLCLSKPETALHLLANCTVTIRLWRRILTSAGLPTTLAPSTDTNNLQDWLCASSLAWPQPQRKQWTSLAHLTWWTIWKERNSRIFSNKAASLSQIHSNLVDEAKNWKDAAGPEHLTCYTDQENLIDSLDC
jgi:hypothetical protein